MKLTFLFKTNYLNTFSLILLLSLISLPSYSANQLTAFSFNINQQQNPNLNLEFIQTASLPSIEKTPYGLSLTFAATQAKDKLLSRYSTQKFNSVIEEVEVYQVNNQLKIDLKTNQEISYVLTPNNKRLHLEITASTTNKTPEKQQANYFHYTGEKISLSYHRVPIRELLAELAAFLKLNLVVSDGVTGELTLELNQIPSDQALDILLTAKGLATRQKGQVMLVAPAAELAKLDAEQQQANLANLAAIPLDDLFIKVNYAKAKDLQEFITNEQQETTPTNSLPLGLPSSLNLAPEAPTKSSSTSNSFLSVRGQLIVDERTNSLYVRDLPENLKRIQRLVTLLDVPVEQVMIEARIVVARTGVSDELGVSWGLHTANQGGVGAVDVTREFTRGVFEHENTLGGSRGGSANFSPDTGFNFGFVSNNLLLDLELAALESENRSEIISQPKVITSDRNKAVIRSGQEIPYSSTNSDGERTTDFRQAELRLEVTPQIVGDGKVFLDLQVNNDSKGEETQDAGPTINTNAVETQILVNNGETLVIGGIFTSEQLHAEFKVPFLGDLPLLGWLFSRSFNSQEKVELLVFVTPKLVSINN